MKAGKAQALQAFFLYLENHWLGQWFDQRLLPLMVT
jgi:hypothetical protein